MTPDYESLAEQLSEANLAAFIVATASPEDLMKHVVLTRFDKTISIAVKVSKRVTDVDQIIDT